MISGSKDPQKEHDMPARATTLKDMIKELTPAQRRKVETRAAQLIAEEMSLRDLRRAHKLTQQRMAKALSIGQDGISRLEQRSDLLLSTLRGYIEAMGGSLTLLAEFPDRQPVKLSGIADMETGQKHPSGKVRRAQAARA
jgi:DNA-binding transcriptional regulator YiaG